jgi:lactate dehydrogenase-like 2-hydroxyacid dehydrogenase
MAGTVLSIVRIAAQSPRRHPWPGDIGKAVARRLEGFAVDIAYCGRKPQDVPYAYYPTPLALAKAVDVLIVLIPGGAATRHTVNAQVLEALGPGGILINVARGSVVDTQALIAALREGKILTAGLDVFEDEPRVPQELIDHPGLSCCRISDQVRYAPARRWGNWWWIIWSAGFRARAR